MSLLAPKIISLTHLEVYYPRPKSPRSEKEEMVAADVIRKCEEISGGRGVGDAV